MSPAIRYQKKLTLSASFLYHKMKYKTKVQVSRKKTFREWDSYGHMAGWVNLYTVVCPVCGEKIQHITEHASGEYLPTLLSQHFDSVHALDYELETTNGCWAINIYICTRQPIKKFRAGFIAVN